MKIQELRSWPPRAAQGGPPVTSRFILTSVDYNSGPVPEAHSEIVLVLLDPVTDQFCSARLGVHDITLALRVYETLRGCEKLTLDQVADRPIVSR